MRGSTREGRYTPGQVTSDWDASVGTQKVNPRAKSTSKEGGPTQWINPKLGCGAAGPSVQNNDQVRRARAH